MKLIRFRRRSSLSCRSRGGCETRPSAASPQVRDPQLSCRRRCASCVATLSARIFRAVSAWPRTHLNFVGAERADSARSSRFHRARLATSLPLLLRHPFSFHPSSHSLAPFTTYSLSETIVSGAPLEIRSSAFTAANNSMRWFVVSADFPPRRIFGFGDRLMTTAYPPGPGFPEHAPST